MLCPILYENKGFWVILAFLAHKKLLEPYRANWPRWTLVDFLLQGL